MHFRARFQAQEHHEFFTTESSHGVYVAHTALRDVGDMFDGGITEVVTERVVDLFQVIEVDDDVRESGDRIVDNDRFLW